jgi:peptidoglycan/LPS O-acetylase OafA/YrhL
VIVRNRKHGRANTRGPICAFVEDVPITPDSHSYRVGGRIDEIQGLRGLAVCLVVAVHAYHTYPLFRAGYLGVDVFFVISGFVITRMLLLEHLRTGSVSIRSFYRKRWWRIFPPLVAASGLALLAIPALSPGFSASQYVLQILLALTFTLNFLSWDIQLYSEIANVLGAAWSLCVEEHFYVVWPVVIVIVMRRAINPIRVLRIIAGLTAAASALLFLLEVLFLPPLAEGPLLASAYFRTECRVGEIALGSFVALSPRRLSLGRPWVYATCVMAVTLASARLEPISITWVATQLMAVSTALLLMTDVRSGAIGRVLRFPWMQQIGEFSYEWYLFHIPIFTIFGLLPVSPGVHTTLAVIVSAYISQQSHARFFLPLRNRLQGSNDALAARLSVVG